jgi:hypothetical protein
MPDLAGAEWADLGLDGWPLAVWQQGCHLAADPV